MSKAVVPDTIPEIEAEIETARAVLKIAQDKFNRRYKLLKDRWNDLRSAELAASENPLAIALEFLTATGENSLGYHFLKEQNKAWEGQGLTFRGSTWTKTAQYVLSVEVDHNFDDDYLARTEAEILKVLPIIRPGISEHEEVKTWKVFKIAESESSNLGFTGTDWVIFVQRYSRLNVTARGNLRAMLTEIGKRWPANKPYVPEEDDEY